MDDWTISSRTYALDTGGGAVHAYVVIKDNTGRVVREYHGLQTDPETGDSAGGNPTSYLPGSGFKLRVWRFQGETEMSKDQVRVTDDEVFRGSRGQVERILADLDQAANEINQQNYKYDAVRVFSESQNSNSVYGTLMRVADERAQRLGARPIEIPERLQQDDIIRDEEGRSSWAPGIHRDLLPDGLSTSTKKVPPLFGNKS